MRLIDRINRPLITVQRAGEPAGAVLIAIIIAITLAAALGAALYTLSSSETYGNVSAALSMRAFYAAESGYRYAVGKYLYDEDGNRRGSDDMGDIVVEMETIQDNELSLPNDLCAFTVTNSPYFFIASEDSDSTSLTVTMPGGVPVLDDEDFDLPDVGDTIWIYIDTDNGPGGGRGGGPGSDVTCYEAEIVSKDLPDSVTFRITDPSFSGTDENDLVYLAAHISGIDTGNDTITLDTDVSSFFPAENGKIQIVEEDGGNDVSDAVYTYDALETHTAHGGGRGGGTATTTELTATGSLDSYIDPGDYVLLRPMVQLVITGKAGGGESAGNVLGRTWENSYLISLLGSDELIGDDSGSGPPTPPVPPGPPGGRSGG